MCADGVESGEKEYIRNTPNRQTTTVLPIHNSDLGAFFFQSTVWWESLLNGNS